MLGDRVRMSAHFNDPGVFIRSMATRGHLGGLARATSDVALVLDAAGKDIVIIETVGVGQDEVDVVRTADISIVVLVPGTGDEVQALKAGIMEIADIFVVNKADREGADRLVQSVAANLSLQTFAAGEWKPPILKTVATGSAGIAELWAAVGAFRAHGETARASRQRARHEYRLRELLSQQFLRRVDEALPAGEFERVVARIAARDLDPYSAVTEIMPNDRFPAADSRITHGETRSPDESRPRSHRYRRGRTSTTRSRSIVTRSASRLRRRKRCGRNGCGRISSPWGSLRSSCSRRRRPIRRSPGSSRSAGPASIT